MTTTAEVAPHEKRHRSEWRTSLAVFLKPPPAKAGLVILAAIFLFIVVGPLLVTVSPYHTSNLINSPPSLAHPFGTDYRGRDLFAQVAFGSHSTLTIAVLAALGADILGSIVGVFAGYYQRLNGILSATNDTVLAFPALPLLILLLLLFTYTDFFVTVLLALLLWAPISRAIRPQVTSLKNLPYVDAAKMSGLSDLRIIAKIIIPGIAPISVAYFILNVATSVIIVTALEFLGIGNVNSVTWGSILYWAQQFAFYNGDWWWILAPGLIISFFAISFALLGFALEEVFNPRLRSRR
ncbi:MAG: ABC transporter permease [Nitrososphaerales archaeon]